MKVTFVVTRNVGEQQRTVLDLVVRDLFTYSLRIWPDKRVEYMLDWFVVDQHTRKDPAFKMLERALAHCRTCIEQHLDEANSRYLWQSWATVETCIDGFNETDHIAKRHKG